MVDENRLITSFVKTVSMDSESFHEREMAQYLKEELQRLGFVDICEDA